MFTLTIQPGFADWEEPIKRYVKRENYGYNMTVYTIDNKISALLIKKRLEELKDGKEVAVKDLKVILTEAQMEELDKAWKEHQEFRKEKIC